MQNWKCRWAPSLGRLESTAEDIWGTPKYIPEKHIEDPTVFFGIYGLKDFYTLWFHKGIRAILWAGSDIIHLRNGYWLDETGQIKVPPKRLAQWMNKYCDNWCENVAETKALKELGIIARICPSFLGDVKEFPVSYKYSSKPKVYASVSGDNFSLYKWDEIDFLASKNPEIEFHLYGNTIPWKSEHKNVVVHGRVPKEQMNAEIKDMQAPIRLLKHDGFSEVVAKGFLMGQWPISEIPYEHSIKPQFISQLLSRREPNLEGRHFYLNKLNKFPWNIST